MNILDNATGGNDGENRQNAETYFDTFLKEFHSYGSYTIDRVINDKFPNDPMFSILHGCSGYLRELLEQRGYIERGNGGNNTYRLKDEGRAAQAAGGHLAYLQQKEIERQNKSRPHTSIVVTGNQNAVGNTQASFERSFNAENNKQATEMPAKKNIKWDIIGVISIIITVLLWFLDTYVFRK